MKKILFILLLSPIAITAQISDECNTIFSQYTNYPETPYGYKTIPLDKNFAYKHKNHILKIDPETNHTDTFASINDSVHFSDFIISPNKKEVLLKINTKAIYRRSSASRLIKYNIKNNTYHNIRNNADSLLVPEYSPKGNYISYVYNNNLYIDSANISMAITNDGKQNNIINGMSDWVYEEEFMLTKAYCWSPNEEYICFLKYNESNVKEYTLTYYDSTYPSAHTYKYPKVGEANSEISICIYNIKNKLTRSISLPHEYIYNIKWENTNNFFLVQTANRFQDSIFAYVIDAEKAKANMIFTESSDTYVEYNNNFTIVNDSICYYTSEKNGRNHLYIKNIQTNTEKQITYGNWDITAIYGISNNNTIYFQSTIEGKLNRSLSSVNRTNELLTIINKEEGYNDAIFNYDLSYYIHNYSNSNSVNTYSLNKNNGTQTAPLFTNQTHQQTFDKLGLIKEFKELVNNNGDTISICITSKSKKRKNSPVLIKVYGGPGYQTIKNKWDYSDYWNNIFIEKGFVIVQIDPRGSFGYGQKYKKQTYKQLGIKEKDDIVFVANTISKEKWCSKKNISIFGWSYGGYMSLLCMTDSISPISNAVSVAPITNWEYYDNVYTERFMQTPQTNSLGYKSTNLCTKATSIRGNVLLIHGMFDDNVHPQHSLMFINALVENGIYIDYYLIPNKNHSMIGSRAYTYQQITNWIIKKSNKNKN